MIPVFKAKVTLTYSQEYVDQLSAKVAQLEADKKVLHDTLTAERRERDELKRALEPFVQDLENWTDENGWTAGAPLNDRICDWFGPSDFRRARAALNQEGRE